MSPSASNVHKSYSHHKNVKYCFVVACIQTTLTLLLRDRFYSFVENVSVMSNSVNFLSLFLSLYVP